MKKIACCGGAGFIGSHLVQRLVRDGHYVAVYDQKYPEFYPINNRPAHEYHIFDLRNDPSFFAAQFGWHRYDEVYQLAAQMGGAGYVFTGEHDAEIVHDSARINLNVLEACRIAKVKKLFFASSACVYPTLKPSHWEGNTYVWNDEACWEKDAGQPDSPYGAEKLFSEIAYDAYARQYDMQVRIGRFHNIFGSHGTWNGGREKAPAAFCRKIAEIEDGGTIECYGDGEQTRSFLHVSEAVEAVVRLMASDFQGPVNIGSNEMVSINQLIGMIAEIAGKAYSAKHIPGPEGVRGRNSDNRLIEEKLGWAPSKSLREGLEQTYPWVAEQVDARKARLTSAKVSA